MLGMHDYLGTEAEEKCNRDGKIIVIGQSEVGKEKLVAVAKNMGIFFYGNEMSSCRTKMRAEFGHDKES